jgi:hypothetical protein
MTKKLTPFKAEQFKATQFDTAAEKAKFANHLANFLLQGCPRSMYSKWFYKHLSLHFNGHIAEYNAEGFWSVWFSNHAKRMAFVQRMAEHGCYGDPAYTFCDVERAMQQWYNRNAELVAEMLADADQAEAAEATAERERVASAAKAQSQQFMVAACSQNVGSFGHRQYIVVAQDGSAYSIEIIPSNLSLTARQVIDVPLKDGKPQWGKFYVECPRRLNNPPAKVVEELWTKVPA